MTTSLISKSTAVLAPSWAELEPSFCSFNGFLRHCSAERQAHFNVAREVDAGPNARLPGFIRERRERMRISRKLMTQCSGGSARQAAMRRGIARVVRGWEDCFQRRVELEWSDCPV